MPAASQVALLSGDAALEKLSQAFLLTTQEVLCRHTVVDLSEKILDLTERGQGFVQRLAIIGLNNSSV